MPARPPLLITLGLLVLSTMASVVILRLFGLSWTYVLYPVVTLALLTPLVLIAAAMQRRVAHSRSASFSDFMMRRGSMSLVWLVGGLAVLLLNSTLFRSLGGSYLVKVITNTHHLAMFLGMAVVYYGIYRAGDALHCRKCGYEMHPSIAGDTGADPCPECAAPWKRAGGTVRGTTHYRKRWIIAGVLIMIALTFWPSFARSRPALRTAPLRILPTSVLIEEAAMGRHGSSPDAWDVLMSRALTPQQEERLARRLLDGRLRHKFMHRPGEQWLVDRNAAGRLPPELARRFVDEHPYPALLNVSPATSPPPPTP